MMKKQYCYANSPTGVPGISEQSKWKTGFFSFGKAASGPKPRRFFNPSLISHSDGHDWLFVRMAEDVTEHRFGMNSIWAFRLNMEHVPQFGMPIKFDGAYPNQHFEDPRIRRIGVDQIALSYTTFVIEPTHDAPGSVAWYGAHQGLSWLDNTFKVQSMLDPVYGGNGGSVLMNGQDKLGKRVNQKNWLWFDHDLFLHLIYMTDPHEIVRWNTDMTVNEVFKDETPWDIWKDFGHARGGTPPVLVDGEYWSFFHSSTDWKEWNRHHPGDAKRRYHMGAYAFEAKPPFRITRISREPLLTGSQMDPWSSGLPLVVFPGGSIFRDGKWFVVMGINDCASAWIEIPHAELLERMQLLHENTQNSTNSKTPIQEEDPADSSDSKPASDHRNQSDDEPMAAEPGKRCRGSKTHGKPGISGDAGNPERPGTGKKRRRRIRRVPWAYRGVSRGNPKPAAVG